MSKAKSVECRSYGAESTSVNILVVFLYINLGSWDVTFEKLTFLLVKGG